MVNNKAKEHVTAMLLSWKDQIEEIKGKNAPFEEKDCEQTLSLLLTHKQCVSSLFSLKEVIYANVRESASKSLTWYFVTGVYYKMLKDLLANTSITCAQKKSIKELLDVVSKRTVQRIIAFMQIILKYPNILLVNTYYTNVVNVASFLKTIDTNDDIHNTFCEPIPQLKFVCNAYKLCLTDNTTGNFIFNFLLKYVSF